MVGKGLEGRPLGLLGQWQVQQQGSGSSRSRSVQWQLQQHGSGSSRSSGRPVAVAGAAGGVQEQWKQICCSGRSSCSRGPGGVETGLLQWQEQKPVPRNSRNKLVAVAGAAARVPWQQEHVCCVGRSSNRDPGAAGSALLQWQEHQQGSGQQKQHLGALRERSVALEAIETASGSIAGVFCGSSSCTSSSLPQPASYRTQHLCRHEIRYQRCKIAKEKD